MIQSEVNINISAFSQVLPWQDNTTPKITPERVTRNYHLRKYFNKIQLNYPSCNFM